MVMVMIESVDNLRDGGVRDLATIKTGRLYISDQMDYHWIN
jgi:hypothetical protein